LFSLTRVHNIKTPSPSFDTGGDFTVSLLLDEK